MKKRPPISGMKDAPEQLDVVVGRGQEVLVEEREGDLVAGAVHDHIGVHLAAVREPDPVALQRGDVRLGRDRAVSDPVEDAPGDRGMGLAELVVWLGQAVALGRAGERLDRLVDHPLADRERHARVVGELVDRLAEHVLGDDPSAFARRQIGVGGHIGGLDGDVHRRVAHAEHDDVLAREDRIVHVGVGVQLVPSKVSAPGNAGSGQRASQWWPLATISAS